MPHAWNHNKPDTYTLATAPQPCAVPVRQSRARGELPQQLLATSPHATLSLPATGANPAARQEQSAAAQPVSFARAARRARRFTGSTGGGVRRRRAGGARR
jgi:hypothetical protein